MDLLERHLEEHDATGQTETMQPMSNFPGISPASAYQPFPTKAIANAPSPNTMAALINILQVQAQAQGLDPQAQQRQLAALLGNMPITGGIPGQQQPLVYPNVHPSQLYAPATGYPYPGVDTPEQSSSSGPGSTAKHPASGTESNGNTPPQARPHDPSSSPDARAPPRTNEAAERSRAIHGVLEMQARKKLDAERDGEAGHVKRKAGDEEMEGHAAHRSRRGEGVDSEDGESVCKLLRFLCVNSPFCRFRGRAR